MPQNDSRTGELRSITKSNSSKLKRNSEDDICELETKRPYQSLCVDLEAAPVFYYNVHKHKPKGCHNLMKVDKIIHKLHQIGFRASRTHFDRAAVKTNCSVRDLQSALSQVM